MAVTAPLTISELQLLNEELLAALRSGVSLDLGLRESSRSLPGRLSRLADQMATHLSEGSSLPESLSKLTPAPPSVYQVLVAAGLRGGQLESVLTRMNEYARVLGDLQETLRRAIIYPVSVLCLAYVLSVAITGLCVPALRDFLTDMRVAPSFPVSAVYFLYDTLPYWGIGIPVVVLSGLLVGILADWVLSQRGGSFGLLRYVPGFRGLLRDSDLSRFAFLLSIQSEHGLPLPESLRRCENAVTDRAIRSFCQVAATDVEQGNPVDPKFLQSRQIPSFLKWLVTVPTTQSQIVTNSRQIADIYRDRTILRAEWIARIVPLVLTLGFGSTVVGLYSWAVFSSLITVWEKVM